MIKHVKDFFIDLIDVLFPLCCLICGIKTKNRHEYICEKCLKKIPKTNYYLLPQKNEMFFLLNKRIKVYYSFALYFFFEKSNLKEIIHTLKYKDCPNLGIFLGEIYGKILSEQYFSKKFDVIIPIPLHKKRLIQRGYNQSEMIAKGINKYLNCIIDTESVIRKKNTETQTSKHIISRERDMFDAFKVVNQQKLENKHILIVDDVFTTGATVVSCSKEILKSCKNCKISICVLCRAR